MSILAIGTMIVQGIAGWFERKQKLAEIKADADAKVVVAEAEAKAKYADKAQEAEISWDQSAVDQMKHSWKDEYFVIVWTVPLWLSMLPFEWAKEAAASFFTTMTYAPDWYVVGFATMIAASFGVRKIIDIMRARK